MGEEERPDEREASEPESEPRVESREHKPRRRRRKWPWMVLAVLLSPVVVIALWAVITLSYSFARGERAGYVQKFSKKGWICKTWEGELAMVNVPGAMQERWQFTVRDDSIARIISSSMGSRVSLSYAQHRGVPTSCFGDTEYFVQGVRVLGQ